MIIRITLRRAVRGYGIRHNGIADLWVKSIPERAEVMISIAHPDFRDSLMDKAIEAGIIPKKAVMTKQEAGADICPP